MSLDGIEIRLATEGDAEVISGLILEAFAPFKEQYTDGAFEYTTPGADVIRGRVSEGPTWLAIDDGEALGTVSGLPEEGSLYIRSMAVRPAVQGRRVGQTLLDALEGYARDKGFRRLYLYTTFVLPGARRLYEKNGFRVTRETLPEEWFDMGGFEMEKVLD